MNGSALKAVSQVNLDEFERRLRAAGAPAGAQEDPLDELARLVGLDVNAAKPAGDSTGVAPAAQAPQAPPARLPHIDEPMNEGGGFDRLLRINFGDAEPKGEGASLRGSLDEEAPAQDHGLPGDAAPSDAVQDEALELAADSTPSPRRSGRIKLTMGVLIGLGAAGLVAAWAIKGAPGLPKTPPIILAVDGPTKVQPPSQETVASPSDSASVLLKDQTSKPGPVNVVSSEEQPVDLQHQTASPATPSAAATLPVAAIPPVAATPGGAATSPGAAAPGPAAVEQPPTRSIGALATVATATAPPAAPAPFPEPKRVKTVSVRPDGSLISSAAGQSADARPSPAPPDAGPSPAIADAAPTAASAPEAPAESAPRPSDVPVPKARPSFNTSANGAAAQPATPKLDLPTKLSGKSTARVPIAKIDTTVAGGTNQAPESPLQIVPNLLGTVAKAVTGQSAKQVAAADPVATSATAAAPTKADGSYAVQLAAPGSEQEAQSASTHLQAKYTTELDGRQPTIHQAEINGRSIYRVRVGGLSKTDAVALCLKLKATGGDAACFVAKD
ncbi:MAG: SPOR domain-containing protein [Roseiarcus sp.]|jgi:hypothetical protein